MDEKRKLEVDLGELAIALDSGSHELYHYLDLETGRVVMVTDETKRDLEEIYNQIYDDETGKRTVSLEAHLQGRDDLRDWMKEMLLEADQIEQGYGTRFISVEPDDPYQGYNDMDRFIATVEEPRLQDRLWDAIRGRGAFRRFKDLVARHPAVQDDWYEFQDTQLQRRLDRWLEAHDIEPILPKAETAT